MNQLGNVAGMEKNVENIVSNRCNRDDLRRKQWTPDHRKAKNILQMGVLISNLLLHVQIWVVPSVPEILEFLALITYNSQPNHNMPKMLY